MKKNKTKNNGNSLSQPADIVSNTLVPLALRHCLSTALPL